MSWSGSGVVPAGFDEAATADLVKNLAVSGNEDHAKERDAAANAAKKAVLEIIESGVLGDNSCGFRFSVGGHANANHVPEGNWAQDCLNISISRQKE